MKRRNSMALCWGREFINVVQRNQNSVLKKSREKNSSIPAVEPVLRRKREFDQVDSIHGAQAELRRFQNVAPVIDRVRPRSS